MNKSGKLDDLYNCVTGLKVDVNEKIDYTILNQIATIEPSENGSKFKYSDKIKVNVATKLITANDITLSTYKDILLQSDIKVFDKVCSLKDVYKKNLEDKLKEDLKSLDQMNKDKNSVFNDSSNNNELNNAIKALENDMKNAFDKLLNLGLKDKVCEYQKYYMNQGKDLMVIIRNKLLYELFISSKIQSVILDLLKAKIIELKTVNDIKANILEVYTIGNNELMKLKDTDDDISVLNKLNDILKEIQTRSICNDITNKDCKINNEHD